ncbi:uncharacterized protein BO96DRAFT_439724 [Aspergillus niger CBS 101883]|uniref:uncharacterized protein n=1 Tax=Aspergillus lacticoffeatus (strain CBS 101883) TaxID=1450533 RepID=UPI000D7FB522|nr:uncharacterized protein BO96DRAFT_439724 [Aspergillus niger CBS 101883]PYH50611.1 hypothetical protein BO96DRAFT_439724 [Aspergillus niger CBS 101883]
MTSRSAYAGWIHGAFVTHAAPPSKNHFQKYKRLGYTHCLPSINHFDMLCQWLGLCDKQYLYMQERHQVVPKRVIFIGTDHSNQLQLQKSAHITQPFDYITLSHCWGKPTDEKMKQFRTIFWNYQKQLEGFSYYSDQKDWEEEGARMDKIFTSVYYMIIFLNRSQNFCQLKGVSSSQKIINNFYKLIYWECGEGVCYENFSILEYPFTRLYLLNSRFPERLVISGYKSIVLFLQELITDYSRRDLTFPKKDKVVAFSGIAERIKKALSTEVRYRIFCCLLSRLLLWKRAGMENDRIVYDDERVPSWSWMLYNSKINFLIKLNLMVPSEQSLSFDDSGRGINIEVRQFEECYTRERDGEHIIFTKTKKVEVTKEVEVGILHFDMGSAAEVESRNCVVIAVSQNDNNDDPNKEYYVLAVQKTSKEEEYERLGVGRVRAGYVSKGSTSGKLL